MNLFLKLKNSKRLMHYKSLFIEYLNFLNDIVYFLPLIFLKDSRKINLVTAADHTFFDSLVQLIKNSIENDYYEKIIIYDLGLSIEQINHLRQKYKFIVIKKFKFSDYPRFVLERDEFNKLGSYAWKSIILCEEIKKTENLVLWMDSANLYKGNIKNLKKIILFRGMYSPISNGTINDWTYSTTLKSMKVNEKIKTKRNLTGGLIGVDPKNQHIVEFLNNWKSACLKPNLIKPEGSTRENHRQDQSLLSILFYQNFSKIYFFKTKRISGIKVNQNPNQKFYILDNDSFTSVKKDWMKNYSSITTNTVFDAKYIFLFSYDDINKIPKKVINKVKNIFIFIEHKKDLVKTESLHEERYIFIYSKNLKLNNLSVEKNYLILTEDLQNSLEKIRAMLQTYI